MSGHDGFKLECIGTIGGLKSIIMPETQLGRPPVIACVVVLGYHQPGDDGGGLFVWMPTSNEDYFVEIDPGTPQQQFQQVDGITVKPTNRAGPGRWKRLFSGPVDIRWLGAQKDGDNTTAIQAAIDSLYPIYIPYDGQNTVFKFGTKLKLRDGTVLLGGGRNTSVIEFTGNCIAI